MDMANPSATTLRTTASTPEQAAQLIGLKSLTNFILYHLPEQLDAITALVRAIEAYAFDAMEASEVGQQVETVYSGITGISRLLRTLQADVGRHNGIVTQAENEADALIYARGTLAPGVLAAIVASAANAESVNNIEDIREGGHALLRLQAADSAFSPALITWQNSMQAQGWKLKLTTSHINNMAYLELTSPTA